MLSPHCIFGVKNTLSLPLNLFATIAANLPNTSPSASIMYQLLFKSETLGIKVLFGLIISSKYIVLYISNDLISQQIKTINSKFYNLHIKRFFLCLLNVNN